MLRAQLRRLHFYFFIAAIILIPSIASAKTFTNEDYSIHLDNSFSEVLREVRKAATGKDIRIYAYSGKHENMNLTVTVSSIDVKYTSDKQREERMRAAVFASLNSLKNSFSQNYKVKKINVSDLEKYTKDGNSIERLNYEVLLNDRKEKGVILAVYTGEKVYIVIGMASAKVKDFKADGFRTVLQSIATMNFLPEQSN